LGRAVSGASTSSGKSSRSSESSSPAGVTTAIAGADGIELARRSRPSSSSKAEKSAAPAAISTEKKRGNTIRVASGGQSRSAASRLDVGGSRADAVKSQRRKGSSSSVKEGGTRKGGGARATTDRKRSASGNKNGSCAAPLAPSANRKQRSAAVTSSGTPQVAVAAGLVVPSSSQSISRKSSSSMEEGDPAAEAAEAASRQLRADEAHGIKRRAVAAALARAAYGRAKRLKYDAIDVDWSPKDHVEGAARRICATLGISSLESPTEGRTGSGGGGRGYGASAPAESGVLNGAEWQTLEMSSLFPLPPPKPPRYVKRGVYSSAPDAAAIAAAATARVLAAAPPPFRPIHHAAIPEGEVLVQAPKPLRATDGIGGIGGVGKSRSSSVSSGVSDVSVDGGGGTGGSAGGGGDTDSQSADGTDDAASTGTATTLDSTESSMTLMQRASAYKAIFKNGGLQPKKRPRSPVVSAPLRLPYPIAPFGVSLATDDLERRPPCTDDHGYVQTEVGSEWAWGLLSEDGQGRDDGDGVARVPHRDFRLPYNVIYDVQYGAFRKEFGILGIRGVNDAMNEFESIQSNVYMGKPPARDDGESDRCRCRPPPDGQAGCTDACSNRATREECSKQTCGLGAKAVCGNRRIQRYTQSNMLKKIEIKEMGAKGIGVVAKVAIPAGTLIGEYVGEVMSEDDWQERQVL
ncbi:unnamed protein product, partial [Sphacelaria rigidula]